MKVTKIIPKTIPLLILRHENPKILSKIGQNVPYLVVLGGYAYTLGGVYYIHLTMQAIELSCFLVDLYSSDIYCSIFMANLQEFLEFILRQKGREFPALSFIIAFQYRW